jgi:hypothetical protein
MAASNSLIYKGYPSEGRTISFIWEYDDKYRVMLQILETKALVT